MALESNGLSTLPLNHTSYEGHSTYGQVWLPAHRMLFHSFHHCAADKKLKSSRSENQTSEAGKCGGFSNSLTPFMTKAQLAGRCDVNGGKGMCSSSQLLDNANDTYEAPSALSPTTKQSLHHNALWAVEEQYESLEGVWNQKSCDKKNGEKETEMGSYLASNDVLLKRDENYEEPVALEKNLNDFHYGNDKEWTMSDPVYEESKPSQLSGLSAAERQSCGKSCNEYENNEADHQESNTSYINARLPPDNNAASASSTLPNVYVNDGNIYDNDDDKHGNDKTAQYVNAKPRSSLSAASGSETMENANIYANEEGAAMSAQGLGMNSNKALAPEETYDHISS